LRRRARHLPATVAGVDTHGASIMCAAMVERLRRQVVEQQAEIRKLRAVATAGEATEVDRMISTHKQNELFASAGV
jgi:hypothetical protein